MARRFRRGRRFGGRRRAISFVRRIASKMGPIEAKRVVLTDFTIPAKTSTSFDNPVVVSLVVCQETVDEEVESNGTNVAEVPLYSKIVGMKTNFTVHGAASGVIIRWLLYKDVDGEAPVTSLADSTWHSSDDTATLRALRGNTLAKGYFVSSDRTAGRVPIFIRRSTLKRLGSLRENDRLKLVLASSNTAGSITGFGTIYARMN